MKPLIFFVLLIVLSSVCVYDPPPKGITVFIENQTDEFVYIASDSLKVKSYLACYDTAHVNGQQYIAANSNYVPPFSKYGYFLTEEHKQDLMTRKTEALNLYIISGTICNTPVDSIVEHHLFRKEVISYKNLHIDSTYHLFIWKDKIKFTSDFDWKQ